MKNTIIVGNKYFALTAYTNEGMIANNVFFVNTRDINGCSDIYLLRKSPRTTQFIFCHHLSREKI
jgi:hypothetical protein